jgi:methanogenic corrinoid protein MtbC1
MLNTKKGYVVMSASFAGLQVVMAQDDEKAIAAEAVKLVESGVSPDDIFQNFVIPHLQEIGNKFGRMEIFLPELIQAADRVKVLQNTLLPYLEADKSKESAATVVIGTVDGDLHDLGKNIVAAMLEVGGFDVHDIGVSVPSKQFIDIAKEKNANVIALSCLLTTSFAYIEDVVRLVKDDAESASRFKIIVGGGPVTKDWALNIGADAYGDNASEAVSECKRLVAMQ